MTLDANDLRCCVDVLARIVRAYAGVEGMKAENKMCEHHGEEPVYAEKSFLSIIESEEIGHNQVVTRLTGGV